MKLKIYFLCNMKHAQFLAFMLVLLLFGVYNPIALAQCTADSTEVNDNTLSDDVPFEDKMKGVLLFVTIVTIFILINKTGGSSPTMLEAFDAAVDNPSCPESAEIVDTKPVPTSSVPSVKSDILPTNANTDFAKKDDLPTFDEIVHRRHVQNEMRRAAIYGNFDIK